MIKAAPVARGASAAPELVLRAQEYLSRRSAAGAPAPDLEDAWQHFYDFCTHKIRLFAFSCQLSQDDVPDCAQEVWRELLVRLPSFRLDLERGQFETWLFCIARGKAVDLFRARRHVADHERRASLQSLTDLHPDPANHLADGELLALTLHHLRDRLGECNFRVLQMRLFEDRPVAEVAEMLGLRNEQVWYRYHRARRQLEEIGRCLAAGTPLPPLCACALNEENKETADSAQGAAAGAVSRSVLPSFPVRQGSPSVDYVFHHLELGRRDLAPEWKVEWNCDDTIPRPVLHIRKLAMVAYAEICGPSEFLSTHWPRIASAAINAGVAAGIATIIATPSAALPVFQAEFRKQMQGKAGATAEEQVHVALSARQEANGPWCECGRG